MVSFQQNIIAVVPSLLIGFLGCSTLHAEEIHVGDGQAYTTISGALGHADSGDEIIVHDGTYDDPSDVNMSFGGDSIILRSLNGPNACFIESAGRAFIFDTSETASAVVQGFTISGNSTSPGGAILCDDADPTIRSCVFINCSSTNEGGAIANVAGSSPKIIDCLFELNEASEGGAIYNKDGSNPTIKNCTFNLNSATTRGGAISSYNNSTPVVSGCLFYANIGSVSGGAVACVNDFGASGISHYVNCTFLNNEANGTGADGGAVFFSISRARLTNCVLVANEAVDDGGAVYSSAGSTPFLTNCTSVENVATDGPEIFQGYGGSGGTLTVRYSIVRNELGGPIAFASGAATAVSYSNISGGFSGGTEIIDEDPGFVSFPGPDDIAGTYDDDLHLMPIDGGDTIDGGPKSSPTFQADAADLDSDSDITEATPGDRDFRTRIVNSIVDMGAYEYRCAGDYDGDGAIDGSDLEDLFEQWIRSSTYTCPLYKDQDFDSDCDVDLDDLVSFFENWGVCPDLDPSVPDPPTFSEPTWVREFGTPASSDKVAVSLSQTGQDVNPTITATLPGGSGVVVRTAPSGAVFFYDADNPGGAPDTGLVVHHNFIALPSGADPGGYDVKYTISNPTTGTKELPTMYLYGHNFEYTQSGSSYQSTIQALSDRFGTHFAQAYTSCTSLTGCNCTPLTAHEFTYPRHAYAPVAVLRGTMQTQTMQSKSIAVGVSVQYPVLDYKHHVTIAHRHQNCYANKWITYIHPGLVRPPCTPEECGDPDFPECDSPDCESDYVLGLSPTQLVRAPIGPGETREYVVSVRYVADELTSDDDDDDWVHTLKPYRDYFWSHYGNQPAYTQNLEPIAGWSMAFEYHLPCATYDCSLPLWGSREDSLLGFRCEGDGTTGRVDSNGWEEAVTYILEQIDQLGNYKRFVMWKPSGVYDYPGCASVPEYPSIIMRNWQGDMLTTADDQFDRFANPLVTDPHYGDPIDLGFWWGNSVRVPSSWDWPWNGSGTSDDYEPPAYVRPLDPGNETDAAEMLAELYTAVVDRHAKLIGLDSLSRIDLWHALPWVARLQELYPEVVFAGEPTCADILHIRLPLALLTDNFVLDNDVPHAPVIADYLLPGREIWVIMATNPVDMSTCRHASVYTGWGLTVLNSKNSATIYDTDNPDAAFLAPYVVCAQNNVHVLPWDQAVPAECENGPIEIPEGTCGTVPECSCRRR